MDFSNSQRREIFKKTLRQGTVFRLKGSQPFPSDKYHVFIVLNYDPQSGDFIYVANGISNYHKCLQVLHMQGIDSNTTTVRIPPEKYSFFPKETMINCNNLSRVRLETIDFTTSDIQIMHGQEIKGDDLQKIKDALCSSTKVSPHIKKLVDPAFGN